MATYKPLGSPEGNAIGFVFSWTPSIISKDPEGAPTIKDLNEAIKNTFEENVPLENLEMDIETGFNGIPVFLKVYNKTKAS